MFHGWEDEKDPTKNHRSKRMVNGIGGDSEEYDILKIK